MSTKIQAKDYRLLWDRIQRLPSGPREKILYQIPLQKLGLLCRISGGDYRKNPNFWKQKLKYDGYLLTDDFDFWLDEALSEYRSLEHLFSLFSKVIDCSINYEKQKEMEDYVGQCYLKYKKKGLPRPDFFKKDPYQESRKCFKKTLHESWKSWWQIHNVYLDLLFQNEIHEIRKNDDKSNKRNRGNIALQIPIDLDGKIPGDYQTLLACYEETEPTLYDEKAEILLSCGGVDPTSEEPNVDYRDAWNCILNRMRRLNDLLETGDFFYQIRPDPIYLFVLRTDSQILLIPAITEASGLDEYSFLFPPEALPFLEEREKPHYDHYILNPRLEFEFQPEGFAIQNGDQVKGYFFDGRDVLKRTKRVKNLKLENRENFFKPTSVKGQEVPELTDQVWLDLAEKYKDNLEWLERN